MTKGWRKESKRHSLAARGVSTIGRPAVNFEMHSGLLDFSNAPTKILVSIMKDKTVSAEVREEALLELESREHACGKLKCSKRDLAKYGIKNPSGNKVIKKRLKFFTFFNEKDAVAASKEVSDKFSVSIVKSKSQFSGRPHEYTLYLSPITNNLGKVKIHTTKNYHRMRVIDPESCQKRSFRTQELGKGTKRVACKLKKSGRWATQTVLVPRGASKKKIARWKQRVRKMKREKK
jgi:hypothetical protein